jgi:NAD(P)-dependent dehydrogenase (short-subunit alcohol dehydrogenase family)
MANNGSITGKVAIVTGAGRGRGRAMALGLARAGVNVIATAARRGDEIAEVAAASGSLSRGGRIIPRGRRRDAGRRRPNGLSVSP